MNESALRRPGETVVSKTHMPFELDRGSPRARRIGMIVLATDHTLEYEWRQIFAGRRGRRALREPHLRTRSNINAETLAEMEKRHGRGGGIILPGTQLDVVAYGCTSGTVVIGEEKVFARIREARPGVACTTPITGGDRRAEGDGREAHRAADPLCRGGEPDAPPLHRGAGHRRAGHGLLQPRERQRGGAHLPGVHQRRDARLGREPGGGRRVRLLHQPAGRRDRRGDGAPSSASRSPRATTPGLALRSGSPGSRTRSRASDGSSASRSGVFGSTEARGDWISGSESSRRGIGMDNGTELEREMTGWRRHLHAYPETGFEEHKTSEFVAATLASLGLEVRAGDRRHRRGRDAPRRRRQSRDRAPGRHGRAQHPRGRRRTAARLAPRRQDACLRP